MLCVSFYVFVDDMENITPERYSSHISRMVFKWVDPLTIKGWKTQLTQDMLWALRIENRYPKDR